jgi:hypothetical protein
MLTIGSLGVRRLGCPGRGAACKSRSPYNSGASQFLPTLAHIEAGRQMAGRIEAPDGRGNGVTHRQ